MNNTIFQIVDIDRDKVHWEDYLFTPTPFEKVGDVWFKREDKFAPLGYGGVNGSKLRQLIYLVNKHSQSSGIISGSSVKSPQISMSAIVGSHFGLPTIQIIGATKPATAIRHENVLIAASLKAQFVISSVAYNPVLQKKTKDLALAKPNWFRLEYGISMPKDASNFDIEAFHAIGAGQVKGFPDVDNLIIPTGSANTAVSILYGLYLEQPKHLKNIYFMLIGPNKMDFLGERLGRVSPKAIEWFMKTYTPNILDINGEGWATYQDEVYASHQDIEFHPTYEGKCWAYLKEKYPSLLHDGTCFWIIGSKPYYQNMAQFLGPVPSEIDLL